jgi:hypothetical protein
LVQGFDNEDVMNFELELNSPSLIYERQKIDLLNEKVNLVGNIVDKNLFSRKYIYENIFNMSEEEWRSDQDRVIEDLKQSFREKQIVEEGNDPKLTKKSFGTPHDLASMQVASKLGDSEIKKLYEPDERENNPGRPEKQGSFERDKDSDFGRDPLGRKAVGKVESYKGLERFVKEVEKSLLKEERGEKHIKMLDENMLLEEL